MELCGELCGLQAERKRGRKKEKKIFCFCQQKLSTESRDFLKARAAVNDEDQDTLKHFDRLPLQTDHSSDLAAEVSEMKLQSWI